MVKHTVYKILIPLAVDYYSYMIECNARRKDSARV